MDPAVLGGGFALGGVALGGLLQFVQAHFQFERQRRLAAEEHQREVIENTNRDLSNKLDVNLAHGDGIVLAAQRIGLGFAEMADLGERLQRLRDVLQVYGIQETSVFLGADSLEDEELKVSVQSHRETCVSLQLRLLHPDSPDFGNVKLFDMPRLESEIDELRQKIDLRRRHLRREGRPL